MKNFYLAAIFLTFSLVTIAQEQGRIRVAGNLGLCTPTAGGGMSIDFLDVRYNIKDNFNVGIKFGGAFMVRDMSDIMSSTVTATMHLNANTMIQSDYYFHKGKSAFAPFLGVGIGSFSIYNIKMEVDPSQSVNYNYTFDEMPLPTRTIGTALRGGFELGRLRLALEYYLIPGTVSYKAENIMQEAGISNNSYATFNFGFYLWGGKWRRK